MKKYNLLVVAHPDDETIFFGGLLQSYRRRPWRVICVTDGNADGAGEQRQRDFSAACQALRVKSHEMWDFPDRYDQRLDVKALTERLRGESPSEVFTHGILGEYGHPHHQDVSAAVHESFEAAPVIWSVAYNAFSEKVFRLTRRAYQKKCEILSRTYFSETHRFARHLPATAQEGFTRVSRAEVRRVYAFLMGGALPVADDLKVYAWFRPYLEEFRRQFLERPF